MNLQTFLVLIINCNTILSVKTKIECGYKQCPQTREGALNVHIIPHTHMDAGWVKTFDEYYYGTRSSVSTANVQLIYHSVLSELLHDKRRKFTFSETAYFWRWWKEQRPQTRGTFRSLVQEGRIQFAGAGWTHADCSTVTYLHALDQATWGLRKLNDTLGPCGKPKAAWQIDTYGHSREMTSLLAQMGFDGLFIGRVDHKEREAMMEEDRMEFMWRGSEVLGKMSDIMTHTLFNLYNAPDGFCFDFLCNDEPIVDDPDSREYNADKRVNDFIAQIERQAKYYDHDNILVTMGGDFTYQSAASWFMNIDKLINHVNTHPANMSDVNIFYSTPSCYLKAIYLYGRRDKAIYTEKGDLLPYGSDSSTYWTGFYTSRPSLKYFIRRAHIFLQVVKQLTVIAQSVDSYELHLLRHAVGLLAHHDAITGTSQQHVTSDFIRTLSEAVDICSKKVSNLLSYLTPTWGSSRRSKNNQHFMICHQLNMSQCRFVESQDSILLIVYNPLSVKTYHYVCLPAIALHYSVRDFNDEEVEYQMVLLSAAVINLPGRSSNAIQEICFEAENIPPLGYTAYYISPIRDQLEENNYAKKQKEPTVDNELIPFISNEYIKVIVDPTTGLLDAIQHADGLRIQISQNFFYYSQSRQTLQSGAYTFRPEKDRPIPVTDKVQFHTIRGTLIKEIRQRFSDWITQVIRLYRGEEFVELEWIVGPVPIGSDLGKEVVSIFASNISNNGEFYTDSNGRTMIKRTCWNDTSTVQQKKALPSCYYPVTSKICLKGSNSSVGMCVLTDRSQGGVSYNDGEIELMIHRRLLTDDGFGLEESLNEEEHGVGLVVKGKHRIVFGNHRQDADGLNFGERVSFAAKRWEYEPWLFFASGDKINKRKWQNVRNKRFSSLRLHGLPRHIHVLTLEPWKGGSVLLRLENTLEKTNRGRYKREADGLEDTTSFITVELRKIFLQLKIRTVRETTLGANQWLDDARQMDWSTRYVYNGGDDGIMTEDIVDDDEHAKQTDNPEDHYSDEEEASYPRKYNRKTPNKNRVKSAKYTYARRKRSPNETKFNDYDDDFGENNLIIDLLNDSPLRIAKVIEIDDNNQRIKRNVNDSVVPLKNMTHNKINELKIESFNDTAEKAEPKLDLKESTTENIDAIVKTTKTIVKKKSKSKENNKNKSKYKHYVDLYEKEEEIRSSEEDFSSNLKKRNRRKNKRGGKKKKEVEEFIYDDSDDGITKSIYEMYYKPRNPYRSERRVKKNGEYEEEIRKKINKNMPFLRDRYVVRDRGSRKVYEDDTTQPTRLKRRNAQIVSDLNDDDYDPDDDDDDDSQEEAKRTPRNRRKRLALPKDEETPETNTSEAEPSDPDYIVTLRPTQIRTFIVWFDRNKKAYTV